jgi:hypothetical protein
LHVVAVVQAAPSAEPVRTAHAKPECPSALGTNAHVVGDAQPADEQHVSSQCAPTQLPERQSDGALQLAPPPAAPSAERPSALASTQ